MSTAAPSRATLDDLARFDGKAELIGGRIVPLMASGDLPSIVAGEIFVSLCAYARATGRGVAYSDGIGFGVPELPSGRESFSPDASYYVGPRPANRMRFVQGPPTLTVEVRSENDYGADAEFEMAAKRADYFAAGTLVVWDVDPLAETVRVFRSDPAAPPVLYKQGDTAEAEPAVPGRTTSVAEIFGAP